MNSPGYENCGNSASLSDKSSFATVKRGNDLSCRDIKYDVLFIASINSHARNKHLIKNRTVCIGMRKK